MLSLIGSFFTPGPLELLVIAAVVGLPLAGGGVVLLVVWLQSRKDRRQATGQSPFGTGRPTADTQPVDAEIVDD